MSEKPKTDWEALYPNNELGTERMAVSLLEGQDAAIMADMGWPSIVRLHRQFRLGRGIADILLEHEDGSVTLIEVKPYGLGLRDYCTGIGQLFYQIVMAASHFQTYRVRKVLCLPGPVPVDVAFACFAADVDILPLPTIGQWHGFKAEAEDAHHASH